MINIPVCYSFISVLLDVTSNVTWLADLTQLRLLVNILIDAVFLKEMAGRLMYFLAQVQSTAKSAVHFAI